MCNELIDNGQYIQYHVHRVNQHGGAEQLQSEPWEDQPPWQNEEGMITDEALQTVYNDL